MPVLTKVTSKGQVVIPVEIRRTLKLKQGSHLVVETAGDLLVMKEVALPHPAAEFTAPTGRQRGRGTAKTVPDIAALRGVLVPVLRRQGVRKAALFGSVARGDATSSSDIDVLVELGSDASLLDLATLKLELEEAAGRRVDVVEYASIKPRLREGILADQVSLL
ncbi:MAG: nucleotidyltransferase domain-containing protein [Euryarchaeota archaeon]|nr:nucleotidyltransferase domain-containing protein [Euryarchaeota archaeon]